MRARLGLVLTLVGVAAALALLVAFTSDDAGESATVQISEVVASSSATLETAAGEQPDWIELHNSGDDPVDLAGWYLADDDDLSGAWEIPELELEPGGYAVVFASGRDEVDGDGHLHTDFAIDRDGEPVVLIADDAVTVVDRMPPVAIPRNASFGRDPADPERWCYFAFPTPGETNTAECFDDESLGAPLLSVGSGFYDEGFDLEISPQTDGGQVIYTIDGSYPDLETNPERTHVLDGPIRIEDRSDEPNTISEIPTTIDPDAVTWTPDPSPTLAGPVPKATVVRARTASSAEATAAYFVGIQHVREGLPVVSLAMDEEHLFDHDTGLLVPGRVFEEHRLEEAFDPDEFSLFLPANYNQRGREWERPFADDLRRAVVMEWCDAGGECVYQRQVGVRVHGGATRAFPRKSLRLYARNDYGDRRFDHDLFAGGAPVGHRRLLLRNSGNDHVETLLADAYFQALMGDFAADTQASEPVVLFINGEYWGLVNLRERYDEHYLELVHGADPDSVAILSSEFGLVADAGDPAHLDSYLDAVEQLWEAEVVDDTAVDAVESRIDLDSFFDFVIAHVFTGNNDWPYNNAKAWMQPVDPDETSVAAPLDGRWRWLIMDLDLFGSGRFAYDVDYDPFEVNLDPQRGPEQFGGIPALFNRLMEHDPSRHAFVNRFADHLNTVLAPANTRGGLDAMEARLLPEIPTHVERWGRPESVTEWQGNVERLRTFVVDRVPAQRQQLLDRFGLDGTAEVVVRHDSGAGTIRVNTLTLAEGLSGVSDPEDWSGIYFAGVPIEVEAIPAPGWEFSHWDGLADDAGAGAERGLLVVDPAGGIELDAVFAPSAD